jgi:peptidoglycan/xylan/chitin deacetylase (PgdA/CDA1 family)
VDADSNGRRTERLARERQLRRRRLVAGALAVVVLAGVVVGVVWALQGKNASKASPRPAKHTRTTRTHQKPSKAVVPPHREAAAVKRFVKLGYPLYCGGHKGKYVALTFDDGPGPYTTQYAFRIFRQAKIRVTWFLVGRLIPGKESVVKRELAFGPVADHTWSHAYLPGLGFGQVAQEMASAQNTIEKASGRPVTLFRPPYGARDARIDAEAKSLGMLQVLWTIDSLDSQGADWKGITREVLNNVRTGSIILFHENRGQTIRALKFNILPALRKRGFRTVTIPEMLALNPPSLKQLKRGPAGC